MIRFQHGGVGSDIGSHSMMRSNQNQRGKAGKGHSGGRVIPREPTSKEVDGDIVGKRNTV